MKKTLRSSIKGISLIFLLISFGCGKDDSAPTPNTYDLKAYQYAVALIDMGPGSLTIGSYRGNIDDREIELIAFNDSTLAFNVGSTEAGVYDLKVQKIDDRKIKLTVLETILDEEPSVIINQFIEEVQTAVGTIEDSEDEEINDDLLTLKNIFNNASEDDQYLMAANYYANKDLFNSIFSGIKNSREKARLGISNIHDNNLLLFGASVIGMGASMTVIVAGEPVAKLLGLVVLKVLYKQTKEYHNSFRDTFFKIVDLVIEAIFGSNRVSSNFQVLVDEPYLFSVSSIKRTLNSSDEINNSGLFSEFFDTRASFIKLIKEVNNAIEFVNEKLPFANFQLLSEPSIPSTSSSTEEDISTHNYSNYNFSIPYNGITTSISLHSTGNIKMIVSASDNVDLSNPIETELTINYTDDFNNQSSSHAITIVKSDDEIPEGNFLKLTDGEYFEILNDYEDCYGGPETEGDYYYEIGTNSGNYLYISFEGFFNNKPELGTYTIDDEDIFLSFNSFDHPSLIHEGYSISSGSVEISTTTDNNTRFKFSGNATYWDYETGGPKNFGAIEGQIIVSCY